MTNKKNKTPKCDKTKELLLQIHKLKLENKLLRSEVESWKADYYGQEETIEKMSMEKNG